MTAVITTCGCHVCFLAPVKASPSQVILQELGIYGRLRKISRCGPVLMFRQLLVLWRDRYDAATIADRVKVMRVVGVQSPL